MLTPHSSISSPSSFHSKAHIPNHSSLPSFYPALHCSSSPFLSSSFRFSYFSMASGLKALWALSMVLLVSNWQHWTCGRATPQVPCYFVFGDSLFDNGNNNYLTTPVKVNYLPYGIDFPTGASGRCSNGLNIADTIGLPFALLYYDRYTITLSFSFNLREIIINFRIRAKSATNVFVAWINMFYYGRNHLFIPFC